MTYGSEVKGFRATLHRWIPFPRACECDVSDAAESLSKIDIGPKTGIPYSSLHTSIRSLVGWELSLLSNTNRLPLNAACLLVKATLLAAG